MTEKEKVEEIMESITVTFPHYKECFCERAEDSL